MPAHLAAGRAGQHGRTPARPGAARGRAGRAGRHRAAPALGRADQPWRCAIRSGWPSARPGPRSRRRGGWPTCSPAARRGIRARHSAEESLWLLWSGTDWPDRLRADAARGGEVGRRANRDLDAVCALFDIAARSEEVAGPPRSDRVPGRGGEPADPRRPDAGVRPARLGRAGAHRPPGQGSGVGRWWWWPASRRAAWPDVRRRGSLLEPDRLGRRRRDRAPVPDGQPDRRGAAAVLRRLHPGPARGWW